MGEVLLRRYRGRSGALECVGEVLQVPYKNFSESGKTEIIEPGIVFLASFRFFC